MNTTFHHLLTMMVVSSGTCIRVPCSNKAQSNMFFLLTEDCEDNGSGKTIVRGYELSFEGHGCLDPERTKASNNTI